MPHNLYLHSGLVLSRKINRASPHRVHEAIRCAHAGPAARRGHASAMTLVLVLVVWAPTQALASGACPAPPVAGGGALGRGAAYT